MKRILATSALALTATLTSGVAASATTSITVVQHGGHVFRGLHRVDYPGRGTLSGTVSGAAVGTRVALEQLAFPFRGSYRIVATTSTRAGGAYSFIVRPTMATRYRAVSGASVSKVVTYYVAAGSRIIRWPNCAGQSTCRATAVADEWFPPPVARIEAGKHTYFYDGIRAGSAPPTRLQLITGARVSVVNLTANRYRYTVAWTMHFPTRSTWQASWCTRDTFSRDGFGLPGSNGCGAASIPYPWQYLG